MSTKMIHQTEKSEVTDYFNGTGFERWNRIYSSSNEVNKVQRNIRTGHQKTIDEVLKWLGKSKDLSKLTYCDAGCGVGSLSIPLALLGAQKIYASDISISMVEEAKRRAKDASIKSSQLTCKVSDLEGITGSFDVVICLDVFIHYPQNEAEKMVQHLSGLSRKKLIVSFAPYSPFLSILKNIGKFFPGPSKTTRAYILREKGIINAAIKCGFKVKRKKLNQAPFYFSKLIEFER